MIIVTIFGFRTNFCLINIQNGSACTVGGNILKLRSDNSITGHNIRLVKEQSILDVRKYSFSKRNIM